VEIHLREILLRLFLKLWQDGVMTLTWDSETGFGLYVGEVTHEESYNYKMIDIPNGTVTIGDHTTPIQAFLDYHLGAMV